MEAIKDTKQIRETKLSKKGFHPNDIELLRRVSDPQINSDGHAVAFVVVDPDLKSNSYKTSIWIVNPELGDSSARKLLSGDSLSLPSWSPDGSCLAFVEYVDGASKIYTYPTKETGERILVGEHDGKVTELRWSPDGSCLAFVARRSDPSQYGSAKEPLAAKDMPARRMDTLRYRLNAVGWTFDRPSHVFVADLKVGGDIRTVVSGRFDAQGISWSPDGRHLCFVSARHEGRDIDLCNDLWTVSIYDGELTRLTKTDKAYALPSWSPDGSKMAYFFNPTPTESPRHMRLAVMNVSSLQERIISAALDRNCSPFGSSRAPLWCDDMVVFGVEDYGNISLYQASTASNLEPTLLLGGDRWISDWHASHDRLVYVSTTPVTLEELWSYSYLLLDTKARIEVSPELPLTNFSKYLLREVDLIAPTRYLAISKDGTEVECWAIPPKDAVQNETYPTILNVHGGPFTQYGNHIFDEFQLQSSAGFGVLYCNPRGSSGYSEDWGRSIRWPECKDDPGSGWGEVDFDDVLACVESAVENFDWVDAKRLGIAGGSYGGYMTSWVISHSDLFKAACSERACNNLLTMEHSADISGFVKSYVGVSYLDNPEPYLRNSPVTYIKNISTPLLILHSEEDLRCPINQAEELYVGLKLLARDVEMVRFPGENHELSRSGSPKHRVERAKLFISWFREHL